jgi:hypothetical protein
MPVKHDPVAKQFEVKVENIENKAGSVAVHDYDDTSSFDTHIDSTVGPTRTAATSTKSPKLVKSSQSTKPFACPLCKKRFMLESRLGAHFRSYPGHMPVQANDGMCYHHSTRGFRRIRILIVYRPFQTLMLAPQAPPRDDPTLVLQFRQKHSHADAHLVNSEWSKHPWKPCMNPICISIVRRSARYQGSQRSRKFNHHHRHSYQGL